MRSISTFRYLSISLTIFLGYLGSVNAQQRMTLSVAAFPAVDEIVKAILPQWNASHPDVAIKVVSRQFNDHHTAMITALSTSSYLPDVMALEQGYVGRLSQGGGLTDLSQAPFNGKQYAAQFVPYAVAQGTSRSGALMAIPTDIGPGTLLYRADLLEKAGVTEADLTRSWDSYIDAGIKIKQVTGAYLMANAQDMKNILIRSNIQLGDGLYYNSQFKAIVNSPRFERAFVLAKKVRDLKLDAKTQAWSPEWAEGFKRGTQATQMSGAWLAGHLSNWIAPNNKGLWRAAQLPEKTWVAYGGTFYAIPRTVTEDRKQLAWQLIQMLTLNRTAQLTAFKAQDAFPSLMATYDDPFFDAPMPFLGEQRARQLWREASRHITAIQVHKQDAFADEVINTELDKVLDQGKPIKAALADAQRLIDYRANR